MRRLAGKGFAGGARLGLAKATFNEESPHGIGGNGNAGSGKEVRDFGVGDLLSFQRDDLGLERLQGVELAVGGRLPLLAPFGEQLAHLFELGVVYGDRVRVHNLYPHVTAYRV